MHFARRGIITEEMLIVAEREGVRPEFVRDEVARGEFDPDVFEPRGWFMGWLVETREWISVGEGRTGHERGCAGGAKLSLGDKMAMPSLSPHHGCRNHRRRQRPRSAYGPVRPRALPRKRQ